MDVVDEIEVQHRWQTLGPGNARKAVFRGTPEACDAWIRARREIPGKRHRFTILDPLLPFRYTLGHN